MNVVINSFINRKDNTSILIAASYEYPEVLQLKEF